MGILTLLSRKWKFLRKRRKQKKRTRTTLIVTMLMIRATMKKRARRRNSEVVDLYTPTCDSHFLTHPILYKVELCMVFAMESSWPPLLTNTNQNDMLSHCEKKKK